MKKECEIINDLLPNYVEDLVSEETRKFVNEHINNCEYCKKKLEILKEDKKKTKIKSKKEQKIELDHLKKYNKKMLYMKIPLIIILVIIAIFIIYILSRYFYKCNIVENTIAKINEVSTSTNYHLYTSEFTKSYITEEEEYSITEIFYKDGKYKEISSYNSKDKSVEKKERYWNEEDLIEENLNKEVNSEEDIIAKNAYNKYYKSGELKMRIPNANLEEGKFALLRNIMLNVRTSFLYGEECYILKNSDSSSYREIWINKEDMLPVLEIEEIYGEQYYEKTFLVDFDTVEDKDVTDKVDDFLEGGLI